MRHVNKVSPKDICLVNAYNHCSQKILEATNVDLEIMPSIPVHSMTISISLCPNDVEIFRLYQYLVNFECRGLFFDKKKYVSR